MATIREIKRKNGQASYNVQIRLGGLRGSSRLGKGVLLWGMAGRMIRRGFTLVEAVIVTVVIVVILAVSIPWMREQHDERERARLQALADTEPWEVFEFRAQPLKEAFTYDRRIIVKVEIVNPTRYPLTLPKSRGVFCLVFEGTVSRASSLLIKHLEETEIAAGKSMLIDAHFVSYAVGVADMTLVFGPRIPFSSTPSYTLPSDQKIYSSNAFQLVVEASDDSDVPTFDEFKVREQERARLQAVAEAEPWKVFEFRAAPTKESFSVNEGIVVRCQIENLTDYRLELPLASNQIILTLRDSDYVFDTQYMYVPIFPKMYIDGGESTTFGVTFLSPGVGAAEFRVSLITREGPSFQSNVFQLVVEATNDSKLPTLDEIIEGIVE